jgi:uncharacterized protein YyaL (SSP411 family)
MARGDAPARDVTGLLAAAGSAIALSLPSHAALVAHQATFRTLAEQGLVQTQQYWWDAKYGWYSGRPTDDPPVASLWSSYPLLEAVAAIAIADPTPANKALVDTTFTQAENFWDPTIEGTGGITWLWGLRNTGNAYFDDAGWWAVAYLDAYRATKNMRWLWDAQRALSYIQQYAWDPVGGGMWWDSDHDHKTAEPLAAATLVAATLYDISHEPYFLEVARSYIAWADANTLVGGLYGRNATDPTVMDYVEGMMIAADAELCRATSDRSWCTKAESIAKASMDTFPTIEPWTPEPDAIYLQSMLQLYAVDGDPTWYALAYANAASAEVNARDENGFLSHDWRGYSMDPGQLFTQSATVELFAWLAATPPPG